MSLLAPLRSLQDVPAPDVAVRFAIGRMVAASRRSLSISTAGDARFAVEMSRRPIAEHVEAANAQHYELPPEFFQICLGPRLKYSCCYYPTGAESLDEAEAAALARPCGQSA